jgi:hypothetical protein
MLSFVIDSFGITDTDDVNSIALVSVTFSKQEKPQNVEMQIGGCKEDMADCNYILRQIAMNAKAFDSIDDSYGYNGETLIEQSFTDLPIGQIINVL